MHSNATKAGDSVVVSERYRVPRREDVCRRERKTRRWCAVGFVVIPVVLILLWLQYASARSSGELFYADRLCGCRDVVASWVTDFVWTQMIWMPCNTLFLLIWIALGVKLWNGGKRRRQG